MAQIVEQNCLRTGLPLGPLQAWLRAGAWQAPRISWADDSGAVTELGIRFVKLSFREGNHVCKTTCLLGILSALLDEGVCAEKAGPRYDFFTDQEIAPPGHAS